MEKTEKKKMSKGFKWFIIILCVCLAAFIAVGTPIIVNKLSERYYSTVNSNSDYMKLVYAQKDEGYGANYENGYSSTDLEPYHVENRNNILPKLNEEPTFRISDSDKMPILDGAEAAYPVYSAFANCCYADADEIAIVYKRWLSTSDNWGYNASEPFMPIQFHNTIIAFENMVDGEADIFFGAKPSENQKWYAQKNGKELVMVPIAKEAFVFFNSESNDINALSSEQLRGIYSGKYTRWNQLGGRNIPILPFQRPKNSGSQTMMEYFMGDTELIEPTEVTYSDFMIGVISDVAAYQNKDSSIGYSFRFFLTKMATSEEQNVKMISIDGVYPDNNTIASGEYPLTTELYAIYLKDNPNENVPKFVDWMLSEQGQQMVEGIGYTRIN